MAQLLNDDITHQVKDLFDKDLNQPVEIIFFGREENCDYCDDTLQLVEEVTDISDKLFLSQYDLEKDSEVAQKYNVKLTPSLVITAREGEALQDYGVRYAGIPSGHEFSSLIHDLILVSGRDSGLSESTRKSIKEIKKPIHLQVFVTPT